MKKLILFTVILLAGTSMIKAEGDTYKETTSTAKVSVNLNPIHSILVKNNRVVLNYNSVEDYNKGVTVKEIAHLEIFSVGSYDVSVSTGEATTFAGPKEGMSADMVKVGLVTDAGTINYKAINSKEVLFSGQSHTSKNGLKIYDISYQGAGDYAFVNYFKDGEGAAATEKTSSYTIDVLYTITTK